MAEINPAELLKKIQSGELYNAYYIYGKDIAAVETTTKAIFKKQIGKNWEKTVVRISGDELDIGNLIDILEICPMFSDKNAVLINDLNAEELTADSLKAFTNAVKNLPEYTLLIINITGFDVKKGKKVLTAKNKKVADCISENGIVCECDLKTLPILVKLIIAKTEKSGCSISKKAAETLAETCHCDSLMIDNELEKLCAYRENNEIRIQDIETMVSVSIETDAFRLSRTIVSYNAPAAMDIVNNLIEKKEEPVAVVSALAMVFVDLYRARSALSANKRTNDVLNDFSYGARKFAVDNAFRDCRKISLESLRKCIFLLKTADKNLKQTGAIPSLILERTVTELLMAVRRK